VFDPDRLPELKTLVREATRGDSGLLDEVMRDVAMLRHSVTTIQPRNTNSISLVASDGGNNSLEFNPFSLHVVRVVDTFGDELFLDVIVFHLLAEGDLRALQKANAHFSDDLLSSLLNEPLPGHGVFWSSVSDTPYPIPVRALLFEKSFEPLDPLYVRPAADCYASRLRSRLRSALDEAVAAQAASPSRPARAWTPPRPSPARPSAGWPGMSSSRPPCERAGASGGGSSSTSWPSACLARSARIIRSGSIGSISTAS